MTPADRLLLWLLRVDAAILLTAVVPIFFPTEWMATLHEQLGLGLFPRQPLMEYLTRSLAASYALHGAMVLFLTFDLPRYRPLVAPLFRLHLLFAGILFGIDWFAPMPRWWIVMETGTIAGFAVVVLWVNHRAQRSIVP
ncbi:MAG: hypothetical protein LC104_10430 [Bacteroidales bacterium]|nr:hypothetical protein [Bacteroidales bacterium]